VALQNALPPGTQTLAMIGLGVLRDQPPNDIQPKLPKGIHLRWAVRPDVGFPWYGFYLFRRPAIRDHATCLGAATVGLRKGLLPSNQFVSNLGTVTSDAPLVLTDDFPEAHGAGLLEFDLRGRTYLSFTPPAEPLSWVEVTVGFYTEGTVRATALLLGNPVEERDVCGRQHEVQTVVLRFDAISEVRIESGPATLINLCYVTVAQGSTWIWETLHDLPYPIRLPLTHPDYPCTPGQSEDLEAARRLASGRVHYGPPAPWISTTVVPTAGTVSVTFGSPVVTGTATQWQADHVGALLTVRGDATAYAVTMVVSPAKLVLSRAYGDASRRDAAYEIRRDSFGQLHDTLVHLVTGGPAGGDMGARVAPEPIAKAGMVAVSAGSPVVVGAGTQWTSDLVGLGFQVAGPSGGKVLVNNSPLVTGVGTQWDREMTGLVFSVAGDDTDYTIVAVTSPVQLLLDRPYESPAGAAQAGPVAYTVIDRTLYTITGVDLAGQRITLDRGYERASAGGRPYVIAATLWAASPGRTAPVVPAHRPLTLVLLASLHAAMAQILGLYWVDRTAKDSLSYDYLLVVDRQGRGGLDPQAVLAELGTNGFANLDGYIAFDLQVGRAAEPLAPPDDLRVYALSPSPVQVPSPNVQDAGNMAGLRWDLGRAPDATVGLSPRTAVMYHLWRADLGDGEVPPNPPRYHLLTEDSPIVVPVSALGPGEASPTPTDWPPFPLHATDAGLAEGWYAYQVSGIDLFGRHSPNSAPARWYEWAPVPDPRPWYYADPPPPSPPGQREISPGGVHDAVRLLNRMPPPPPTGDEAYALDPEDPTVVKDAAYNRWRGSLDPAVRDTLIGLRVRWLWTRAHMRQAPATREFRLYLYDQPGRPNAVLGRTRTTRAVSDTESAVDTDVPNALGAGAYGGAELRVGTESFPVVGNDAGTPLRILVERDPSDDTGTASVTRNSVRVIGAGTHWDRRVAGLNFRVAGEQISYAIAGVDGPTSLVLVQPYVGDTAADKAYAIAGRFPRAGVPCTIVIPDGHPLWVDVSEAANWQKRIHVVDFAEHETLGGSVYERVAAQVIAMQDAVGRDLRGAAATVVGGAVMVDGTQDLTDPGLIGVPLILQNDRDPAQRTYGLLIQSVDAPARTVTVDGQPDVGDAPSPWVIGSPLRTYEVFMPAPDAGDGEPFAPTIADPVKYAQIGVTAADANPRVPDDPIWAQPGRGDLGGRPGNEGRIAGPATIVRVRREPPLAPDVPPFGSARVYATAADYHSRSYYTVRWTPAAGLGTHIFRALDDTVFQGDWAWRRALIGQPAPPSPFVLSPDAQRDIDAYFPAEWRVNDPGNPDYPATRARRAAIADGLNRLNTLNPTGGFDDVRTAYRALTDDALRVLAGLPTTQRAFTQLTIQPLNPDEPDPDNPGVLQWRNRRGPDDPDTFVVGDPANPLADPALRVYIDAVDGRSSNRYFYRAGYVDGAHNRSRDLSLSTPPVYLPKVTPPRTPVITKVLAVPDRDRQIAVRWASNREPDLREYRVFRTGSRQAVRDVGLMDQVHVEAVPAGDPMVRPAEVSWVDAAVPGQGTFYYRVVAVAADDLGRLTNVSPPSPPLAGRALDTYRPASPRWDPPVPGGPNALALSWTSPIANLSCFVERKVPAATTWDAINPNGWLPRGVYTYTDRTRIPGLAYVYRLRVLDDQGRTNRDFQLLNA
jgi:hypothetical protein